MDPPTIHEESEVNRPASGHRDSPAQCACLSIPADVHPPSPSLDGLLKQVSSFFRSSAVPASLRVGVQRDASRWRTPSPSAQSISHLIVLGTAVKHPALSTSEALP